MERVFSLHEECSATSDTESRRVAPIEIDPISCCERQIDLMSADEPDFFPHREEELEVGSFSLFGEGHHDSYSDTIVRTETRLVAPENSIFYYESDSCR